MKKIVNKVIYSEMRQSIEGRQKEVIYLYFDCGYTEKEIAKRIGFSQQHINRIKREALKTMKKCLE
jgi:RNA polymerase sigma factor (sigma-70 family)